ncbi:hypothetical protein GDO86_002853 [Hymenochirus boettgeri]|uniref:Uncharacterized protein n=1 Tax=Hymenochirus boettgeri TaxID=247094 RepID=A0A8T2JYV4_9PIPI|nr:hypothetical protein GDO86_002853 [Hymenochirus boettgeri]
MGFVIRLVVIVLFSGSVTCIDRAVWSISPVNQPGLNCETQSLQYNIPTRLPKVFSVRLRALDHKGKPVQLSNSSECGIWLGTNTEGSVSLHAAYGGCYIQEQDSDHVMTISIEREYSPGKWASPKVEELRCPTLNDLHPLSTEHCSTVLKEERVPCANFPITQDACQKQGCCFDSSEGNLQCFYGSKVTVQCRYRRQLSVALSKDLTLPQLDIDSAHLMKGQGAACKPVIKTSSFVLFQFPPSSCATTTRETRKQAIYENNLIVRMDTAVRPGDVTLTREFRLHVKCHVKSPPKNPTLLPADNFTSVGLELEMRIAKGEQFVVQADPPHEEGSSWEEEGARIAIVGGCLLVILLAIGIFRRVKKRNNSTM